MTESPPGEVSQLLKDWGAGNESALNKLTPLVHDELLKIAHRFMVKERSGHTLQTTALVNEVYVRLLGSINVSWHDRAHFFALSAQLMRRILVDHARCRGRAKRGGAVRNLSLEESIAIPVGRDTNIIALDDALNALAAADARKAKMVELRFFIGLSVEETAKVLNVSASTVMSDWKFAKVWLLHEMQGKQKSNEA
jgi:RNA polymerase sigma factor (TIGR02999 family)